MNWLNLIKTFYLRAGKTILPVVIAATGTLAILLLWHQLSVQEELHVKQLIQQEAKAIESHISNQLTSRIIALKRIANRWSASGGTPKELWEADVATQIQDYDGYQAIEWIDPSFQVRWVVPAKGNEAAQNLDLSKEPRRRTALQIARELRQPFVTRTISLAQGGKGFLASIPLFVGDRFDGFILGVFEINSLFNSILAVPQGYQVRIYDGAELIYSRGADSSLPADRSTTIEPYGVNWRIEVVATPELLANVRSPLPTVVLVSGLAAVWLFALVIYMAEISYARLHQFKHTNYKLKKEIGKRQQIEAALQISQSRFAGILDIASDAIISVDSNQCISLFNQGAERIFGYQAEEVLGKPLTLLMPNRFSQAHVQHINNYAQTQEPARQMAKRGAIFGRRKDGTEFPAEASISKLALNGEIIFTTFLRDITERLKAEQALQQSESRFKAFMNHSPMAAWITDDNGIIIYLNDTYLKTFQVTTENLIGKSIFDIYSSEITQEFLNNIQTVARTEKVLEAIEEAPRSDGSLGQFLVYKFPLSKTSTQILIGGIALDITERQKAEAAISRLAAIVEFSEDAIISKSLNGLITSWNSGAERIFGYRAEEILGKPLRTLIPASYIGEEAEIITRIEQGQGIKHYETVRLRKDGTLINVSVSVSPIRDAEGKVIGASKIVRDITERKHIEMELRQAMEAAEAANIAKSIFLANMSHELRTPLNVILGFAQVMARDPALTTEQAENLETIRRSGDHLLGLINDVLDLSKIEAGRSTLDESAFDLINLLRSLQNMLIEKANSKGIKLQFYIDSNVPQFIIADEQKLRQVLLNLLGNAVKFTDIGSIKLTVSLPPVTEKSPILAPANLNGSFSPSSLERLVLIFEVADTGVGIAPAELNTIFDAFVQAQAGKKSVHGTGLGLTISRKMIELMGGEISVISTLGEGTKFTFTIPVRLTTEVNVEPKQGKNLVIGLASNQPHYRLLVVDDQRENRLLLIKLLRQLGLEIREATNGLEAVKLWQEWHPDLIWMDIRMPVLDGYEATRRIRASKEGQSTIIIALTAQVSQGDRTLALAAGCNDYITKPFREETLFAKMTQYLGLEYLYTEENIVKNERVDSLSHPLNETQLISLHDLDLTALSEEWFFQLENGAMGGEDYTIYELIDQLPPSLVEFANCLTNLVDNFQFEQIIQLLQTRSKKDE